MPYNEMLKWAAVGLGNYMRALVAAQAKEAEISSTIKSFELPGERDGGNVQGSCMCSQPSTLPGTQPPLTANSKATRNKRPQPATAARTAATSRSRLSAHRTIVKGEAAAAPYTLPGGSQQQAVLEAPSLAPVTAGGKAEEEE